MGNYTHIILMVYYTIVPRVELPLAMIDGHECWKNADDNVLKYYLPETGARIYIMLCAARKNRRNAQMMQ